MKYLVQGLGCLLLASAGVVAQEPEKMAVPDFRQWVFLTSSLDLNYGTSNPPSQHMLDNVFVDPKAYGVFVKTGVWPDKTILIKENRLAESAGTLSKRGFFQGAVKDVEIHIKDAKRPGGWAFFTSPDGKAPGVLEPQSANCYSCHQEHAAVDTVFVQFFPTLMPIAEAKGTLSEAYRKAFGQQSGK
jgi:hypothetical protein